MLQKELTDLNEVLYFRVGIKYVVLYCCIPIS
jgi:hypothetical protein